MPRLRRPHPLDHPLLYKVISACLIGYGLVLAVLLVNTLTEGLNIETRIQAITPQVRDNPAVAEANRVLDRRFADLAVLALAGPDKGAVEQAEQSARAMLADAGEAAVQAEQAIYRRYEALIDVYRPYRFGLLSEADRRRLEEGDAASIRRAAAQRLVDIQSGPRALPFAADPLGLFDDFFRSLPFFENPAAGTAEGYLTDRDARGETEYIKPLILEVTGDALDLDDQRAFVERLDDIGSSLTRQFPSVDVYRSGLVFHSAHAAERSKREFSSISAISMTCIIALFAYCFRSLRPLLLGVACLGFSFGAALLVTNRLFADVHILTLVFGAGLIGVAIDYSLHYFANEYFGHENTGVLNRVLPSLAMGLLTTVAGYACLYQTSMPALYEVATFCITGLVSAWLFVVVLYPWLGANRAPAAVPGFVYRCASVFGSGWRRLGVRKSLAGLTVMALIGTAVLITAGRSENNVRLLYDPPRHILEQDRKITSLLPERSANQYFVVTGADAQQVLQREEQLRQRLGALMDSGALKGYTALSRYVPSRARQQHNRALQRDALYGPDGAMAQLAEQFGLEAEVEHSLIERFKASAGRYLAPDAFLPDAPAAVRSLWLGEHDNTVATMISLSGIRDLDAVAVADDDNAGVIFVDRVAALSTHLQDQHRQAIRLLTGAYGIIALIVLLRYRRPGALAIVLIPAVAALIGLAVLTLSGVALSLFHVLALYLALGLGLDYGIFLYDSNAGLQARIAVLLSAATSSLSFGLLSLSSTPMIASFGLTVLITVTVSLLISSLLIGRGRPAAGRA